MLKNLINKRVILGSGSPRRRELLSGLGLQFEVLVRETDESFDPGLKGPEIPMHIAEMKANAFDDMRSEHEVVITADTVVWINDRALNKPADRNEAIAMISELSGQVHDVFTAVCVQCGKKREVFFDQTKVHFSKLTAEEMAYYVDHFKPYDKAGAYGAQDWIGLVGIDRLEGSYFNVMGLPVHKLYQVLKSL